MLTKLTLSIDRETVAKAKVYAHKKRRSVSKIVEEYLKTVSDIDVVNNHDFGHEGRITKSITGMFKKEYDGKPYKDLLESALAEKYL